MKKGQQVLVFFIIKQFVIQIKAKDFGNTKRMLSRFFLPSVEGKYKKRNHICDSFFKSG